VSWQGLEDFVTRCRKRLDPVRGSERLPETGDMDVLGVEEMLAIRPAAVLIGIVERGDEAMAVLTRRPETMVRHAGQVAFPGGKIDPTDADAAEAALREANEEVGADPETVELIGRSSPYVTGSQFRVTPVVGLLPAEFHAVPDPDEVAEVFEVPMAWLMDPANQAIKTAQWQGRERRYVEMPYGRHRIWGVTAGIIRNLYIILYGRPDGRV